MDRRAIFGVFLPLLALVAAPSHAAVQLQASWLLLQTINDFDDYEPGLGTVTRNFSVSDIGGCEGADEAGEPNCGAFENGSFSLTLTNNLLDYAATIQQDHAIVGNMPDTLISIAAVFRANRRMRFSAIESRDVEVFRCGGSCPSSLQSSFGQAQLGDGSWEAFVNLSSAAAVFEAAQHFDHSFRIAVAEVPEPEHWMLMVVGFGIVGIAARRRRPIAASMTN